MKLLLLMSIFLTTLFSFELGLDIGHNFKNYGTTSATGEKEYTYNLNLAKKIKKNLDKDFNISLTKNNIYNNNISFKERIEFSNDKDLLISIHHDSVQEKDVIVKNKAFITDKAEGFSILISNQNKYFKNSALFAEILGKNLINNNLKVNTYHNQNIKGESKEFYNKNLGVYLYNDTYILKNSLSPSILLEVSVISNPKDEKNAKNLKYQQKVIDSIKKSIIEYNSMINY